MLLTADHEKWLAIALAMLAVMLFLAAIAARGRSWRWRIVGIVLPLLASLFISLALAGTAAGKHQVVILLDLSPSARTMPWRDPAWLIDLARRRLPDNCHVVIVGFHGSTQEIIASGTLDKITEAWPANWRWITSTSSETSQAIGTDVNTLLAWRTREETDHPNQTPAPRWIITDGLFSPPDVQPKMEVAWTSLPPASADVAVTDVHVRPVGAPGEFELLTQIRIAARAKRSADPFTVHVDILRDDVPLLRQDMSFHLDSSVDAARWVSVRDTLTETARSLPHYYKVTATLRPAPDPWPENDHGEYILPATTGLRTLVIGKREPALPHTAWIKPEEFILTPEQLAAQGWQTVILEDIPAENVDSKLQPLTFDAARTLQHAVEGNGTGLLILGNGHAFGPGHYGETSTAGQILDHLSPLASHPPGESGRRILFLLDASASMNEAATLRNVGATERKISWASVGILDAARRLPPGDRVTVIAFNTTCRTLFDGPSSPTMDDLARALHDLSPAGETAPDTALNAVTASLGNTPPQGTPPPMLILLTDGEIPQMNVPQWQAVIETARAKLVLIAPPASPTDQSILRRLAAITGASWAQSSDPATWRDELVDAVMTQLRGTFNHEPLHWTSTLETPLAGDTTAWTRVWQNDATPLITGKTETEQNLPLAAIAQRGLGKVAALAIGDDGSQTYRALVERLAKQVAAPPGDPRFSASIKPISDKSWILSIDAVGDAGFINLPPSESLQAQLLDNRGTSSIALFQTAPGHYEADMQSDGAFVASMVRLPSRELIARVQSPATETAEWPATVTTPYTPAPDQTILSPDDTSQWNPAPAARLNLTPACWIAAALCALTALWLRR